MNNQNANELNFEYQMFNRYNEESNTLPNYINYQKFQSNQDYNHQYQKNHTNNAFQKEYNNSQNIHYNMNPKKRIVRPMSSNVYSNNLRNLNLNNLEVQKEPQIRYNNNEESSSFYNTMNHKIINNTIIHNKITKPFEDEEQRKKIIQKKKE